MTDTSGNVVAGIELDPWGAETNRSWNGSMQPHRFTTYERNWTGDESLFRRYHGWWSRFAHPDPYDGSYNFSDPQSLNRYAYVQNDPVNFADPSGLCTFNVNLNASDLTSQQIKTIKQTMQGLFSAAQQRLVFNNSFAARGTTRGSFNFTKNEPVNFVNPSNAKRTGRSACPTVPTFCSD